jgi:hypothetical protein
VTSITDSGVGLYDVNLTTAMPDANYAINVTAYSASSAVYVVKQLCGNGYMVTCQDSGSNKPTFMNHNP